MKLSSVVEATIHLTLLLQGVDGYGRDVFLSFVSKKLLVVRRWVSKFFVLVLRCFKMGFGAESFDTTDFGNHCLS